MVDYEEATSRLNARWRKRMLSSLMIIISGEIIFEIIWYALSYVLRDGFDMPAAYFVLQYPVISAIINIPILICARTINSSSRFSGSFKNRCVCMALFIFCVEVQILHCDFVPLMTAPAVAIIIGVTMADMRFAMAELLASMGTACIATARASSMGYCASMAMAVNNLVISLVLLSGVFFVIQTVAQYKRDQLQSLRTMMDRQASLMEEMKIDPLTGLFNRKTFDTSINIRVSKMKENTLKGLTPDRQPIMAILDIDLFKHINDTYGHICGDDVLVKLASCMRQRTLGVASSFRYGGEEFVILFDKSTREEVLGILKEIRSDFSSAEYSFAPGVHITVSAGAAELKPQMDAKTWFEIADSALYEAKNTGRDRVVFSEKSNI